ncbi:MAG: hypothetical protein COA49_03325 [Bacteroidetes bacterium]|nr:MAG: hypothetical protein COA49_03325 [Bacteroidota bacterium]
MRKFDFIVYFGFPEFKSITGSKFKNLIALTLIIFISIIAIGLGNSATLYLKKKMDNPFIKFLNVTIDYSNKIDVNILDSINLKTHYGYSTIEPVKFNRLTMVSPTHGEFEVTVRLIRESSVFYNFIKTDPEISKTEMYLEDEKFGCIVTEEFLTEMGYSLGNVSFIYYLNYRTSDTIPIQISGIVSQLPDYADMLISKEFFNAISEDGRLDVNSGFHNGYLQFYIPNVNKIPKDLMSSGYSIIGDYNLVTSSGIIIEKKGSFNGVEISNLANNYPGAIRLYDYAKNPTSITDEYVNKPDHISFSFNHLDSISSFSKYLDHTFGLKVDMNTIESKKNFDFFNKLSNLLSLSLIFFSIFSIFIFTTHLIINHLDNNKLSLGTLKAFGLANKTVIAIYVFISIIIVSIAFIIAHLLSFFLGGMILDFLISVANIGVDQNIIYTNVQLPWLIVSFILIPIISVYYRLWRRLRNSTPGDLIYGR